MLFKMYNSILYKYIILIKKFLVLTVDKILFIDNVFKFKFVKKGISEMDYIIKNVNEQTKHIEHTKVCKF